MALLEFHRVGEPAQGVAERADRELDEALARLDKENMKALVLDLRNDPGGLLDIAVKAASRFIPPQKLVATTQGR